MTTTHLTRLKPLCCALVLGMLLVPRIHFGQPRVLTLAEAEQMAFENNPSLKAATYETASARYEKRAASEIPKTQVLWMSGQYNSINKDNNFTFTQSLPFPTVFSSHAKLGERRIESSLHREEVTRNELVYRIRQVHETLGYLYAHEQLLLSQDSLFSEMVRTTALQLTTGEGTLLLKTAAETRHNEVKNQFRQNQADQLSYKAQLRTLLYTEEDVTFRREPFTPLTTTLTNDPTLVMNNPQLALQQSQREVALQEKRVETNRTLPDFTVGYFSQSLIGIQTLLDGSDQTYTSSDHFTGFMLGVAVPLWFVPANSRIKAASARSDAARLQTEYLERQLHGQWAEAVQQFEKFRNSLDYYHTSALPNADLLIRQSGIAFRAGEINRADFRLNIQQALAIKESYIQTVLYYNQSIHTLEFLSGNFQNNK